MWTTMKTVKSHPKHGRRAPINDKKCLESAKSLWCFKQESEFNRIEKKGLFFCAETYCVCIRKMMEQTRKKEEETTVKSESLEQRVEKSFEDMSVDELNSLTAEKRREHMMKAVSQRSN